MSELRITIQLKNIYIACVYIAYLDWKVHCQSSYPNFGSVLPLLCSPIRFDNYDFLKKMCQILLRVRQLFLCDNCFEKNVLKTTLIHTLRCQVYHIMQCSS